MTCCIYVSIKWKEMMRIDQSIKFRDWIPIETSIPLRKRLSFDHRSCLSGTFYTDAESSVSISVTPSVFTPCQLSHWHLLTSSAGSALSRSVSLGKQSGVFVRVCVLESRHIILCKWAMQMQAERYQDNLTFFFFLSSPIHLRLFVFIVIIIARQLLCSDGTSGRKNCTLVSGVFHRGQSHGTQRQLTHVSCTGKCDGCSN